MEQILLVAELIESAFGSQFQLLDSRANNISFQITNIDQGTNLIFTLYSNSTKPEVKLESRKLSSRQQNQIYNSCINYIEENNCDWNDCFQICQFVSNSIEQLPTQSIPISFSISSTSSNLRVFIYFHHIMSTQKKKIITEEADRLQLTGVWRTGFPGIIVIQGQEDNLQEYLSILRSLGWQQMTIRGEWRLPEVISSEESVVDFSKKPQIQTTDRLLLVEEVSDVHRWMEREGMGEEYRKCMKLT